MFITIEGIEGSGKSTQAKFVVDFMRKLSLPIIHTREPGGTKLAEQIREILLAKQNIEPINAITELLLIFAARSQHLNNLILPALKVGTYVICERFTDASFAYQGGGRGLDPAVITWLEQFVQKDLRPDLIILLDLEPKLALERVKLRGQLDRIEQEKLEFFVRVRNMYLQRAQENPEKYMIINANQEELIIKQQITAVLTNNLNLS